MEEYLADFIAEMKEKAAEMRELFQRLKSSESQDERAEILEEMLRCAHTMKGSSSLARFQRLTQATHWLETILDLIIQGKLQLNDGTLSVVEGFIDATSTLVASIEGTGHEADVNLSYLIAKATQLVMDSRKSEGVFQNIRLTEKGKPQHIKVRFDSVPDKIPNWLFSLLSTLNRLGEVIGSNPDVEKVIRGKEVLAGGKIELTIRSPRDSNEIAEELRKSPGVREVEVLDDGDGEKAYTVEVVLGEEVPLKAARALLILQSLKRAGEVISTEPGREEVEKGILLQGRVFRSAIKTDRKPEELEAAVKRHHGVVDVRISPAEEMELQKAGKHLKTPAIGGESTKASYTHREGSPLRKTVRVDVDDLDRLLGSVEELMIVSDWMEKVAISEKCRECPQLGSIRAKLAEGLKNLRKVVFRLRTVPLKRVVEDMIPALLELAEALGKEVDIRVEGPELRVDRHVVEALWEAFIHILRNAIVHGIEPPEERERAGKPRRGTVSISINPNGDYVEIEISDDGRGINVEEIKRRAVKAGIIREEEAKGMSHDEALNLIFEGGISTETTVSENAGRGIGLNVVREVVKSLQGIIEVRSKPGEGASFIIRVPFEVSILKAYILEIEGQRYALPAVGIAGEVSFDRKAIRKLGRNYLVMVGGDLLPAVLLHGVLEPTAFPGEKLEGVVVETGKGKIALLADRVEDKRTIVVKSLRGVALSREDRKLYSGVTVIGGKEIVPVVNLGEIIRGVY